MQLSGANLLLASQQTVRGATKAPAEPQFAGALAQAKGVESFEPMQFRAAPAKPTATAAPSAPAAPSYGGPARIGSTVDIRV